MRSSHQGSKSQEKKSAPSTKKKEKKRRLFRPGDSGGANALAVCGPAQKKKDERSAGAPGGYKLKEHRASKDIRSLYSVTFRMHNGTLFTF